ncbi:MAG: PH domain-containing protein [Patescibacteria group bacterium]
MLELNKKYTLGKRTFWFLFLKNGKTVTLVTILILAAMLAMYIGATGTWTSEFLATHFDGIITKGMLLLWLSLGVLSLAIVLFIGLFEHFAQHKFMLDDHSFHIRRGIFMIKEKVIPYRHIQNVDLEQPYHYRIFGVARLNITTARIDVFDDEGKGKNGQRAESHGKNNLIPIIDKKIAKELAHYLVSQGDRRI